MSTWVERLTDTPAKRSLYEQEAAVAAATKCVCRLMQEQGVTKAELARRLGVSRPSVTQTLADGHNITVRTMAAMAAALGCRVTFNLEPLGR